MPPGDNKPKPPQGAVGGKNLRSKGIEGDTDAPAVNLTPSAWQFMDNMLETKVKNQFKIYESKSKANFNKEFQSLNDQISSLSGRLDTINNTYNEKIEKINEKLDSGNVNLDEATLLRIQAVEAKVDKCLATIEERDRCREVLDHHFLIKIAEREQRDRLWSVRIKNLQTPWSAKQLSDSEVYDLVVKPVLDGLIENGDSSEFDTSYYACCEHSHPLAKRKGPTPHVIRFFSRRTLFLFMLNKKYHIESLVKRANNKKEWTTAAAVQFNPSKILKVSHDMCDLNRSTMTFLYSSGIALKCKISGLGVSFIPKHATKWIRVRNPYGKSLKDLVTPLPSIQECMDNNSLIMNFIKDNPTDLKLYFKDLTINTPELIQAAAKFLRKQADEEEEDIQEEATNKEQPQHVPSVEDYPSLVSDVSAGPPAVRLASNVPVASSTVSKKAGPPAVSRASDDEQSTAVASAAVGEDAERAASPLVPDLEVDQATDESINESEQISTS